MLQLRSQSCAPLAGSCELPVHEEVHCAGATGALGWAHACHPTEHQHLARMGSCMEAQDRKACGLNKYRLTPLAQHGTNDKMQAGWNICKMLPPGNMLCNRQRHLCRHSWESSIHFIGVTTYRAHSIIIQWWGCYLECRAAAVSAELWVRYPELLSPATAHACSKDEQCCRAQIAYVQALCSEEISRAACSS